MPSIDFLFLQVYLFFLQVQVGISWINWASTENQTLSRSYILWYSANPYLHLHHLVLQTLSFYSANIH